MEQDAKELGDYLSALRRRKGQMLGVMLVILIVSLAVAFGLPPVYQSSAIILIEQQEIPEDLVRSTVTSYADQRVQIINQRVMTSSNLGKIIEKFNLYAKEREQEPLEVVLENMKEDIGMELVSAEVVDPRTGRPTQATIAFQVSYENRSPEMAHRVANELTSLYLNENIKTRTEMATETTVFLQAEAEKLNSEIAELERELALFKERNVNQLPELMQLNLNLMDRVERDIEQVDQEARALEERKIYLESELAQLHPYNTMFSETGERILGPSDRLKVLKTEFLSKSAVYAVDHPDLTKMRKEISALEKEVSGGSDKSELLRQLEKQRAELASLRERYSPEHPDVKRLERSVAGLTEELDKPSKGVSKERPDTEPDNPAYIQLQAQLEAANAELRSLALKRKELVSKLEDFEQRLVKTPQVEREYRSLARDYENALAKYQEIKAKLMEAQLAESLESERKGERFTLIEPPLLPEEPTKPNRLAIAFLGVVFSFAGGIGTAAVAESMDTAVRGAKGVSQIVGAVPLVAIPYIETAVDIRKRWFKRFALLLLLIIIGMGALAAIHLLVIPLDVAWFMLLRKLGVEG